MSRTVISVENLGKEYVIGGREKGGDTFREMIGTALAAPFRRLRHLSGQATREERIWALKGVSFEVEDGEVLGIIGRNGAGKSTLLKILSRITAPTEGRAEIKGRVSSLLEIGTGFHPELTGRENIYLNSAILGMSRSEINRKFEEIVDFSGVEQFLDTPVKRYSTGMSVRLAFAVAAHLEPEILIIDEVLAVGDAEFQKKCLGKMGEVAGRGRTVLFVSHNMNAIERLCHRVIYLENGTVAGCYQDVRRGIINYLQSGSNRDSVPCHWQRTDDLPHNDYFVPEDLRISNAASPELTAAPLSNHFDLLVEVKGQVIRTDPGLNIGICVYSDEGTLLFMSMSTDAGHFELLPGPLHLEVRIPRRFLNEGTYRLELVASLHFRAWLLAPGHTAPMLTFSIQGGLSDSPYWDGKREGLFAPVLRWADRGNERPSVYRELSDAS